MAEKDLAAVPRWHRELDCFTKIKSTIVVDGDIYDGYQYPVTDPDGSVVRQIPKPNLEAYLDTFLADRGYDIVVFFDPVDGLHEVKRPGQLAAFNQLVKIEERYAGQASKPADYYAALDELLASLAQPDGLKSSKLSRNTAGDFGKAAELAALVLGNPRIATAVVFTMASRYIINPSALSADETASFTKLFKRSLAPAIVQRRVSEASQSESAPAGSPLNNLMILVPDKVNDIPAWFYFGNTNVKTVHISPPSFSERRSYMERVLEQLAQSEPLSEHSAERLADDLANATDGFATSDLTSLSRLISANVEEGSQPGFDQLRELITLYKYGISENPWDAMDKEIVERVQDEIDTNVKGQHSATEKVMDVIKRSMIGLSGVQHGSGTKPKGVMFFAGPTGTGKTQTAKALAKGLFGDENRCVRFDMSEYAQSHSDQKLFGAPPGYVGYDAGGQLTNIMREKPFSVLLFDEIEKASPSILDKFLQVLEDGRMTDGQGNTVYFTDSIIIFTSNLGMAESPNVVYERLEVGPQMTYGEFKGRLETNVKNFFKHGIGRPELLNRFGDNIVVFDYIRAQAADAIFDMQLRNIREQLHKSRRIDLEISEKALSQLRDEIGITDAESRHIGLENGGRGVGNTLESHLVNPLARYIFDHQISGTRLRVDEIDASGERIRTLCSS